MAGSSLCFRFLVLVVAINQSLADSDSDNSSSPEYNPSYNHVRSSPDSTTRRDIGNSMYNDHEEIPHLFINDGNSIPNIKLGRKFIVSCSVVVTSNNKAEYEPKWQMRDDSARAIETKLGPIPVEERSSTNVRNLWLKGTSLQFQHFEPTDAGYWTCELWSLAENKIVERESVELSVDPDSWDIQWENPLEEHMMKKNDPLICTLLIKNVESFEGFDIQWYWPNGKKIKSAMKPVTTMALSDHRVVIRTYLLLRMAVGGTYKVIVSKNGESKSLEAKVWICSGTSSSRITMESSFLTLVVAWLACRSVAFGTIA